MVIRFGIAAAGLALLVSTGSEAMAQANWTGVNLGVFAVYQAMKSTSSFDFPGNPGVPAAGSVDFNDWDVVGGAQLGFNWQPAGTPVVVGIEADFTDANMHNGGVIFRYSNTVDHFDGNSRLGLQESVRGRVGFAVGNVLPYLTGGVAVGQATALTSITRDGVGSASFTAKKRLLGWTAGAGTDWLLPYPNWSIRGEYRYTHLGSINFGPTCTATPPACVTFPAVGGPWTAKAEFATHDIRFGVNYKF